jgi:hypothetical protein
MGVKMDVKKELKKTETYLEELGKKEQEALQRYQEAAQELERVKQGIQKKIPETKMRQIYLDSLDRGLSLERARGRAYDEFLNKGYGEENLVDVIAKFKKQDEEKVAETSEVADEVVAEVVVETPTQEVAQPPKPKGRRGRPKGSKNKPKVEDIPPPLPANFSDEDFIDPLDEDY